MNFYHIAPFKHLDVVKEEKYHMVIASFLERKDYWTFYARQRKMKGRVILLDNGAFEKGQPMDNEEYLHWIARLRPDRVVIPDDPTDVKRSVALGLEFIEKASNVLGDLAGKIDWMAVLHGQTIEDLNYEYAYYAGECTTLGIPYMHWKKTPWQRAGIATLIPEKVCKVHYLGAMSLGDIMKAPPRVGSVDTSLPWKMVQKEKTLNWERQMDESEIRRVKDNIRIIKTMAEASACKSSSEKK